jgi:hypothetical protein
VRKKPAAFAALALSLLPLSGAAALDAPVAVSWGVVVESLLDHSVDSKIASPSINFNLGAGLSLALGQGGFSFEPSADLYWANYEYLNGRPVPSDNTFGSAFGLGLLLDAPIVFTQPLGGAFSLGLGLGLGFDLRVAFTLDSAYKAEDTALMNGYFWEKGRFFTPTSLLRVQYRLTDRAEFGFSGRVLWPIYNLWIGEGYGFFDRAKYLIDLTILYRLPQKAQPAAPADTGQPG